MRSIIEVTSTKDNPNRLVRSQSWSLFMVYARRSSSLKDLQNTYYKVWD